MKTFLSCLIVAGVALSADAASKHLLVVTTTKGFRHSSIPVAERIIGELA
ncbi:MAG TPA: ThuA domain-containing protein, partial [Verrucomicrobiales bacterium]|nr:ThuA domain-containing protein [Verrucomicrobiales bacterium]